MNRFKELRTAAGLSQAALANKLNVHQTAVSQWELGKSFPEIDTLAKMAEIYDVFIDYIVGKRDRSEDTSMFPEKLKELRKRKGLTQVELANELNVATGTIGMYETGKRSPDNETLLKIAEYFDVTVDELLRGDEKKPANNSELINGDPELTDYLEMLATRPECRMLFHISKNATKEDVEKAVAIIEALRRTEGRD